MKSPVGGYREDGDELRLRGIGVLGNAILSLLLSTTRVSATGAEEVRALRRGGKPVIFILWHGRLLPLTYHHRGEGIIALISRHRDGEYIARTVQHWGFGTVRGSSSRGGTAALRELVRLVRQGHSLAITPDGPRGPGQRMKRGALLIAQLTGAPIVAGSAGTDRGWWIRSWDRFLIPKPFSTVRIAYGEPIRVPRDATEADLERLEAHAQQSLDRLTRAVDEG